MIEYINKKRVLFITTKNLDYIRNTQEIALLKEHALSYDVIGSCHRSYPFRLFKVYLQLLMTHVSQYDTVMIGFAPQLVLPLWYWKVKKADIVIDFFISMYDTLCCDRKRVKADGFMGRLLHGVDAFTLRKADVIICDTKAHGHYFCEEFQAEREKLVTVYLQADSSVYYPRVVRKPDYLENKYVVLYFGSVLPLQGVEVVLKSMELLKNKEGLHFFFIGPISDKSLLAIRPVSDNIEYFTWLSQEKLAEYIAMSDLCLAGHFNASILKAYRTIPGKAYIYHAMGKPMILGDNPANHELFDGDNKVSFVEMGNEIALANEIIRFLTSNDN